MSFRSTITTIVSLVLLLIPLTLSAHPLGVAITYENSHFPLDIAGTSYQTHLSEINLDLRDHLGHYILVGVHGGYIGVTEDSNPALSGLDVSGYDAGVSATGTVPLLRHWGITLSAADTYHDASASIPTGQDRLHWYDATGRLGIWFRAQELRLSAGGYLRHLEGTEFVAPPHAESQPILGQTLSGPYAAISYVTHEGGRIALFVDGGRWHGVSLSFRYGF